MLVNNAGRSQRSLIKDTDWLVDQQMVDLNLMGQVSLTKTILPHFIQKNGGQVVVTSSMAGKLGEDIIDQMYYYATVLNYVYIVYENAVT